MTRSATRGVMYVHSAPSALCPHVEWAVGGVLGMSVSFDWTVQPAQASAHRTEEPTASSEGARYSYTPELGVFHAVTGLHGDIMIPEDRLKAAVVKAALGDTTLLLEIDKLLGKPWDDELETFRHAGDGAAVRWLHQVV